MSQKQNQKKKSQVEGKANIKPEYFIYHPFTVPKHI